RLVLLAVGLPSMLWALLLLVIKEPVRRHDQIFEENVPPAAGQDSLSPILRRMAPVFLVVAVASMVDNAVGAWAPSLLIRQFGLDPAKVGVELGLLLMLGYGGGMLAGGALADRFAIWRGRNGKIELCCLAVVATSPAAVMINSHSASGVMFAVPIYFALSAVVTASGLSAILDATPNRMRGRAMAISFFLNVAIGAGFGPTAVALAGDHVFGPGAGLGPAISFTVVVSYLLAALVLAAAIRTRRSRCNHLTKTPSSCTTCGSKWWPRPAPSCTARPRRATVSSCAVNCSIFRTGRDFPFIRWRQYSRCWLQSSG